MVNLTEADAPAGYAHPAYAESLAEFGTPRLLRHSGGWVLERKIPSTKAHDAMGCYPLFSCPNWSGLSADLEEIDKDLVCLSLVTDPFGVYDEGYLRVCFRELVVPFKQHFISCLDRPIETIVSKHHRYYARKALNRVSVERCDEPKAFLDDWIELYAHLTAHHGIHGIKAFSRTAFAAQLETPGLVMFRAVCEGKTVGAHLWYKQCAVAHSHLAAVNALGYELMAAYALYWFALESFAAEVRWLNWGAGAGLDSQGADGLTTFKRGWATETRTAYFCGRIFDHEEYQNLLTARGVLPNDYFPAYRQGEFN